MSLDKKVLPLGTTAGVNELQRAELLVGGMLVAENVMQNRQGGWVRRPGQVVLTQSDDFAENLYQPRLAFQSGTGLCAIATPASTDGSSAAKFCYAYNDVAFKFYRQNRAPEFGVKQWEVVGEDCDDFSIGDYYACFVKTYQSYWALWVVDKESGNVVKVYKTVSNSPATSVKIARCAHAGGRYLHVYIVNVSVAAVNQVCYQVDTAILPAGPSVGGGTNYKVGDVGTTDAEITLRWPKAWSGPTCTTMIQPYGGTYAGAIFSRVTTMDSSGVPVSADLPGNCGCPTSAGNIIMADFGAVLNTVRFRRYAQSTLAAVGTFGDVTKNYAHGALGPEPPFRIDVRNGVEDDVVFYSCVPHTVAGGLFGVWHRVGITYDGALGLTTSIMGQHPCQPTGAPVSKGELYQCTDVVYSSECNRWYALMQRGWSEGAVQASPGAGATSLSVGLLDLDGRAFVLDVTDTPLNYSNVSQSQGATQPFFWYRLRVAAVIGTSGVKTLTKFDTSAGLAIPYVAHSRQSAAGSWVTVLTELNYKFTSITPSVATQGTVLSGALVAQHDGEELHEAQWVDRPIITKMTLTVNASGVPAGVTQYVVVHRYIDGRGNNVTSETFGPYVVNIAAANYVDLVIGVPMLTAMGYGNASGSRTVTELYKTAPNGTVYYLAASTSSAGNLSAPALSLTNTLGGAAGSGLPCAPSYTFRDDATNTGTALTSRKKLYRLPGTQGTALNRGCAPPSVHVCHHRDRIFAVEATGKRIAYSSFFVDGEGPWWNAGGFILSPQGGTGRITACASMDGRLLVFKEDAVFVVDGDGPPENGGSGTEFSPPIKIADVGALDGRSVVSTPEGVFFRSKRGIEQVGKNFKVEFVGGNVLNQTDAYKLVQYAVYDSVNDRIMFGLANTISYLGAPSGGACVVMDLRTKSWYTWKIYDYGSGATYGCGTHACIGKIPDVPVNQGGEAPIIVDSQYFFWRMDPTVGADFGSFNVNTRMVFPWQKTSGPEGRSRFYDVQVLFSKADLSNVKLSLAYDYAPAPAQTRTWTDAEIAALPGTTSGLQLNIQPNRESCTAIQLTVEDIAATVGTPITYRGIELYGVSLELAAKGGITKLPAAAKA